MKWFFGVFLVKFALALPANLLKSTTCGTNKILCEFLEYCSSDRHTCEPCAEPCNESSHNFDAYICRENCQDFLRDARYLKSTGSDANLKVTVDSLSRLISVTLALVCFMLIVLACLLSFQLYRWKKKKNITIATLKQKFFSKKTDANPDGKQNTPATKHEMKKSDLRLEMGTTTLGSQSDHSPGTMTTSISRKPAEDSALDYAYDNPAMAVTPSPR